jgi:alpha-L-fucosidase|tara:strand:+ start:234 stop:488 length:255 start_codon:yes stop_codon:yes gene_type:complete
MNLTEQGGTKSIQELVDCSDEVVSKKARMVLEIQDLYRTDSISADEMKELLEDIVRLDEMEKMRANTEMMSYLITSVYAITSIL